MPTLSPEFLDAIALDAAAESPLWGECAVAVPDRELVFSPLGEPRFALGLETIYEAYLVHFGRPRLFAPPDADTALLLGDYLYAHGLVRIAELEETAAVTDLAELISLCAQLRAQEVAGDGAAWAATAAALGTGVLAPARAALRVDGDAAPLERLARELAGDGAVKRAFAAHARRAA